MAKSFNTLKNKFSDESKARIQKRVESALQEMPLAELRQARMYTQQQIADTLKIKQASVSKMEGQADMYISTIRKYIEAMGGELEIIAKFPEGNIKVERFENLDLLQKKC
jgi:predicted XRE-type DNA-binding protein